VITISTWNGKQFQIGDYLDEDEELELTIVELDNDDPEKDNHVSTFIYKSEIKNLIQHLINIISD
jgi:hypothetical protein